MNEESIHYGFFYYYFLNKMWLCSKIRNSIPPTTTLDNFNEKLREATGKCFVDTAFWGGVIPGNEVESSAPGWVLTELYVNHCRLLTAGNPTHDPGWSSWLQVFPHSQRGGGVSTCDWLGSAHSHEAASRHWKCFTGEHVDTNISH